MSRENNKVPRLRFPEFRDAGDWEEKRLGELSHEKLANGVFNDPAKVGSGYRLINVKDMYATHFINVNKLTRVAISKTEFAKNKALYGDIFFTRSSLVKEGIAHSNVFLGHSEETTFDGHLIRFRPNQIKANPIFLFFLLKSNYLRRQLISRGKTGTMTTIGQDDISTVKMFVPHPEEQQKIADCLSSLDDLITAQTQKLAHLKTHKKGLMQQLFPAEGETLPKLRFPEFQDAGDWEECKLGNCLARHPEYGINAPAVPYSDNLPTYLRITDISEEGHFLQNQKVSVAKKVIEESYLCEGDIVLARTGASVGKSYKYKKKDGELVFAGFLIRVRTNEEKLNSELLLQFLSTEQYWRWVDFSSARSGQPGINSNEYASLPVRLPTLPEQQKIADCLSSLDELITAQTQKLAHLKTHKKGLMQQLFPTADEVNK